MINKEISAIIKSRHSIYPKYFTGKIIPKEVIVELLENANYAPTHKMTQPWRFKVFFADQKIALLEEIIKKTKDITEKRKKKLEEKFHKSSHIICICMKRNRNLLPEWEEIAATSMAVQNLWLSCVGSDIGGYWSTPRNINNIRSFLALNKDERCLGFFYLGVHNYENRRDISRGDINEKIQWFR